MCVLVFVNVYKLLSKNVYCVSVCVVMFEAHEMRCGRGGGGMRTRYRKEDERDRHIGRKRYRERERESESVCVCIRMFPSE